MSDSSRLPAQFPVGTKYVLESRGRIVSRYVEFPDGRKVQLELRKAQTCTCTLLRTGNLPAGSIAGVRPTRRKLTRTAA